MVNYVCMLFVECMFVGRKDAMLSVKEVPLKGKNRQTTSGALLPSLMWISFLLWVTKLKSDLRNLELCM